MKWLYWILELFYPSRCPFCNRIYREGICPACTVLHPVIEHPYCFKCGKPLRYDSQEYCSDCESGEPVFECGRSLWVNRGGAASGVYRFKYQNCRSFGLVFAKELFKHCGGFVWRSHVLQILPVPVSKRKRRQRGFNQTEILALHLGALLGIEVNTRALVRCRETHPQKRLTPEERRQNLFGAFSVCEGEALQSRVLLVDDIYTTGATINEISKVLKGAGVDEVYFLTVSIGQQY